jgi:hypothetical protein
VWNSLPANVKSNQTLSTFKSGAKKHSWRNMKMVEDILGDNPKWRKMHHHTVKLKHPHQSTVQSMRKNDDGRRYL